MGSMTLVMKVQGCGRPLPISCWMPLFPFSWLCENSEIIPFTLPRSLGFNSLGMKQEGRGIQFSFLSPVAMARIMTSNLKITGKKKAHTFFIHTSLSPELRAVRLLGPHSCHLWGQISGQAVLPPRQPYPKSEHTPSAQPLAQKDSARRPPH